MAGRRDQIKLTEAEQAELLDTERVVVVDHERPPRLAALDADVVRRPRRRDLGLDLREVAEGPQPRARPAGDAAGRDRDRVHRAARGADRGGGRADPRPRPGGRVRRSSSPSATPRGSSRSRATPPPRCGPRRRSGSRSGSSRSASPPGTTASSAAPTRRLPPAPASFTNALYDGFALPLASSSPELAAPVADARRLVLPAEPVDLLDVQLAALLDEVLVDLLQQLALTLGAEVERVAAAGRAGADLGHPHADVLVARVLDHLAVEVDLVADLLDALRRRGAARRRRSSCSRPSRRRASPGTPSRRSPCASRPARACRRARRRRRCRANGSRPRRT